MSPATPIPTGDRAWGSGWVEADDDGGATAAAGQIRITGGVLQFDQGNGAAIQRTINLAGATSARLSFDADPNNLDAGEAVCVLYSADGVTFNQLDVISGNGPNTTRAFNLTGPFTANAAIRFEVSAINANNETVNIENLSILVTTPAAAPTIDVEATFTEGGASAPIASLPSITDDSATMASARIVLTNAESGDQLIVGGLPAGIAGAIDATVAGRINVTLTGVASRAAYQDAIQAISFRNGSQAPVTDDRIIQVTVNDGLVDSNVATSILRVVAVNDAPNAANDRIVTNNVNGAAFTVPDWGLMANDSDADSDFAISGVGGANSLTATRPTGGPVTITDTGAANGGSFTYTVTDGVAAATATATVQVVRDVNGPITGGNGADILIGDGVASTFDGAGGDDLIFAGGGDDTINWSVNGGRDFADGGAGTLDRFVVNGGATAETFVVYAASDAIAAGFTNLKPGAEIVITRNGAVIAELDNIEEITINTGAGADTVTTVGNFNPTSLNFNTITIEGGAGDDTIDISGLQSAHRIVFRSNGGNDTVVGTLRPQDVIELAPGQSFDGYSRIENPDGATTLSNGTHSITFLGAGVVAPDGGAQGGFALTARDIEGLQNLVAGRPAYAGDDDTEGATGVRTLSGHGNNFANPDAGAADTPFIRLTNAHYGAPDGFGNLSINPVFSGLDPRAISNALGVQEAGLPKADANILFMAFGQYFDHGLDFIGKGGNGAIQIGAPGTGAPGSGNPADLTRATVASYEGGVAQHINKTSPFVDQNQAYGSNDLVGQFLREGDGNGGLGARLLTGAPDPSNPDFNLLPTLRELILHHWDNNTVFQSDTLPGGSTSFRAYFPGLVTNGVIDASMLPAMTSNFMGSTHALLLDTNPFISLLDHYVVGDGRRQ